MSDKFGRRVLMRNMLLGGVGIGVSSTLSSAKAAELCLRTPQQTKGPFYPVEKKLDQNADLTIKDGSSRRAKGQVIYIEGKVLSVDCTPIAGALVEIWQACESGRYDHPSDPNQAPLDPDFQYFGKVLSGVDGSYMFKTILPGAYPADRNWMRPPHIHYRVVMPGHKELITQLYFEGNELNDIDLIRMDLTEEERNAVTAKLLPPPSLDFEPGSLVCEFNVTLTKLSRRPLNR